MKNDDRVEMKEYFTKVGDRIDRKLYYNNGKTWVLIREDKDYPIVFIDPPGKKMEWVEKSSTWSKEEFKRLESTK